jgi:hypothetical protein
MTLTAMALVLLGMARLSSTWTITAGLRLAVMSTMAVNAALPALALGGHRS